ncbi:putative toxin-antitoxin system toxin component, PIN family [Myxococcota bacterium]|nr:putative toxin-antitoxin system toxin component, PIN family [Myxococcota bacterium]
MANLGVVLGTNVLMSRIAFPTSMPGRIVGAWRHSHLDVVLSPFILSELRRVLPRLSHRHGLSEAEMDDLVDVLCFAAHVVEPAPCTDGRRGRHLRDPADEPILATLVAAREAQLAEALLTGHGDLLALSVDWPVVTPAAFWAAHGRPTPRRCETAALVL